METRNQKSGQQNQTSSKIPVSVVQVSASLTAVGKDGKMDAPGEGAQTTEILGAIRSLQNDFSKKFDDVLLAISGFKGDLQIQANRINEAEDRIGRAEDSITSMHSAIKKLQEKCDILETKVDDQENRGRRNNLRLIGLPEKAEGQDMCTFLEGWLPRALGTDTFPSPLVIERAHRIGRHNVGQDSKPRAVIMRFLNFREKENAMRAARRQRTVKFENHNVRFYPDLSAEIHRQRKPFDAVKVQLQSMGLRYGMFYPADLVITHNGQRHSFKTAPDAEKFIRGIQETARSTPTRNDG